MKKGSFSKCASVFYLSDQFSPNTDANDKKAMFITQFLLNNNVKCNIYVQCCSMEMTSYMRLKSSEDIPPHNMVS